jgi:hypothetical protein
MIKMRIDRNKMGALNSIGKILIRARRFRKKAIMIKRHMMI